MQCCSQMFLEPLVLFICTANWNSKPPQDGVVGRIPVAEDRHANRIERYGRTSPRAQITFRRCDAACLERELEVDQVHLPRGPVDDGEVQSLVRLERCRLLNNAPGSSELGRAAAAASWMELWRQFRSALWCQPRPSTMGRSSWSYPLTRHRVDAPGMEEAFTELVWIMSRYARSKNRQSQNFIPENRQRGPLGPPRRGLPSCSGWAATAKSGKRPVQQPGEDVESMRFVRME